MNETRSGFQGFVKLEDHEVYAEHLPAGEGRPTLVLLNGLSNETRDWDPFVEKLAIPGCGVLRLDFRGQGRSLEREIDTTGEFRKTVKVEEQTEDLEALLAHFGIADPVDLLGFSYGGGIALDFATRAPGRVRNLILVVPYLIRLDRALPLQRAWARQLELLKGMGVLSGALLEPAEKWYSHFLGHYMDYRFRGALPDPVLRDASIRLTFGIMEYNALETLDRLPERSLHLISVGRDTLVPQGLYGEMWEKTPELSRQSWLHVEDGMHLLLEQAPAFCARWVERVLAGDPKLGEGRRFEGRICAFEATDSEDRDSEAAIDLHDRVF